MRVFDSWWLDVKLGIRMPIKYPGLALSGGIGIAVAVAIAAGGFSVVLVMMTVGLLAALDPTRRSLRIQPTEALKEQ